MNGNISRRGFVKTAAAAAAIGYAGGLRVGDLAAEDPACAENGYHSRWHLMPDRYGTGPATWANPWEDWQIQQGKLVSIKSGSAKRTVHCVTHQLNEKAEPAEIAVTVQYCGAKADETGKGLVQPSRLLADLLPRLRLEKRKELRKTGRGRAVLGPDLLGLSSCRERRHGSIR